MQLTCRDTVLPPANNASGTFSIDFAVRGINYDDSDVIALCNSHAFLLGNVFSEHRQVEPDLWTWPTFNASPTTTPVASSAAHHRSIQSLYTQPTFNMVSAQSLLETFRSMLAYCPFITLPTEATVSQLSVTKPFVLLAILASASGARNLPGHSLYDEEFRKILALKVVVSGEQTIELLQGLLIYCIW